MKCEKEFAIHMERVQLLSNIEIFSLEMAGKYITIVYSEKILLSLKMFKYLSILRSQEIRAIIAFALGFEFTF